jgi:hypothetical protein
MPTAALTNGALVCPAVRSEVVVTTEPSKEIMKRTVEQWLGETVTLMVSGPACVTLTEVENTGVQVCPLLVQVIAMSRRSSLALACAEIWSR